MFLFLPITLWVFHRLCVTGNGYAAKLWLVLASLGFYGYWEPKYLILILASIAVNHIVALMLERLSTDRGRWWLLALGVSANLLAIAWFKYAGFFITASNDVFGTEFHVRTIILPLAISFFTFQQIAYLVEVYRRRHGAGSIGTYLLFVTFFPQLIAGPIVNYKDMAPQYEKITSGLVSSNLLLGLMIFALGLFKKVIIADSVAPYSDTVFAMAAAGAEPSLLEAWAGALAYSLQLYFDFSGYSDMAIGLGCMVGIRLPQNFNSPYKASSIIEFWRRWHISLSNFLRDYLYVPLGGSKKGTARTLINLCIVMVLGGLWHGAGWTFIAWGALHGVFLLINHSWRLWFPAKAPAMGFIALLQMPKTLFYHLLTLTAIVVAWVLFRANTIAEALVILRGMFGLNGVALPTSWEHRHAGLTETLKQLGISFQELATLGPLFTPIGDLMRITGQGNALNSAGTLTALLSMLIPIAAVLVLPNSSRLASIQLTPRFVWVAGPVCAFLAAYAAFGGSGTSQFLYFNF